MLKWILPVFLLIVSCAKETPADLIISGGKIYTVDGNMPTAEAVAVRGDTIVFVGLKSEAMKFRDDHTREIDLNGKSMFPGFIEGHGHLLDLGYLEMHLNLTETKSFDEIVEKVKLAASKVEPGQWIIGFGWHQDKWTTKPERLVKDFPTHHQLTEVSPDNPVFLEHVSGHMGLVNEKAMQLMGVSGINREKVVTNVDGGEIVRDELGNPTGLFNENSLQLITGIINERSTSLDSVAIALAMSVCNRNGITGFHNAGYDPVVAVRSKDILTTLQRFRDRGNLTVRIYEMLSGWKPELLREYFSKGPFIDPEHWLTIRSVKLNCDGALGSRGAWLLEPYTDFPSSVGMPTFPMDSVYGVAKLALQSGFQVCSHAIGDKANQEILNRYERAFKEIPDKAQNARFRIEHAQHLHPEDIPRFAQLGVIPAMQAIHLSSDRPWAIDRLGEKRLVNGAYVWQKLLQSGARIVNGTDVPVEPINPIACFYASVTRKTLKGEPEGGYESDQKMTREQALKSYTIDAAYGAFEENIKGSIEVGKLADFTILSKDIMTIDENNLLSTEVMMTIVGGKVVFEKGD